MNKFNVLLEDIYNFRKAQIVNIIYEKNNNIFNVVSYVLSSI